MQYFRRALKYFLQICILFVLIIGALMLSGMVSKDVAVAFQKGWTSVGYIAVAFLVMSAAYPYFGYGKRKIRANGEPADYRKVILEAMDTRGYRLVSEKDGEMRFCLKSPWPACSVYMKILLPLPLFWADSKPKASSAT